MSITIMAANHSAERSLPWVHGMPQRNSILNSSMKAATGNFSLYCDSTGLTLFVFQRDKNKSSLKGKR